MRTHTVVAIVLMLAVTACGDVEDDAHDDPLDLAREQVAAQAGTAIATTGDVAELPAPDPVTFVGRHRVVNVWAGPRGVTQALDVWARRTVTTGPVLLAEGIGFGAASEYLAAPPGHQLVVVGAGAGPDGLGLAVLAALADREQATTVITNDDDAGSLTAIVIWEIDPDGSDPTSAPPVEGLGLVVLRAVNTTAFETPLTLSLGGADFLVGEAGRDDCLRQRIEDDGFAPVTLGRVRPVEIELAPGEHALTLHPAAATIGCEAPSVLDIPVESVAGASTMVLVVSLDGQSIEAFAFPIPLV